MKNTLNTRIGNLDEQRTRISLNCTFDRMREVGRWNENELKNFLLRQVEATNIMKNTGDMSLYGGFNLSYEQALGYFNEITQ